jgi:hypothetical protein
LLSDEHRLLSSVKVDMVSLKAEVEGMHAFLKKMSEVEDPDEQSKCWMQEVRELSYDIEDNIDSFMLTLGSCTESSSKPRGFKGCVARFLNLFAGAKAHHWAAKEIQRLKRQAVEASDRRGRYSHRVDDAVAVPRSSRTSIDPRLPALYAETTRLVGVDGPRNRLIKLLTTEREGTVTELNVFSIVGSGGLGKTTLASEVYRRLEAQFDYRAFVSVSQNPDMKKILRHILCHRGCGGSEEWDEQQLIHAVREFLQDKRYACIVYLNSSHGNLALKEYYLSAASTRQQGHALINLCKFVLGTLLSLTIYGAHQHGGLSDVLFLKTTVPVGY